MHPHLRYPLTNMHTDSRQTLTFFRSFSIFFDYGSGSHLCLTTETEKTHHENLSLSCVCPSVSLFLSFPLPPSFSLTHTHACMDVHTHLHSLSPLKNSKAPLFDVPDQNKIILKQQQQKTLQSPSIIHQTLTINCFPLPYLTPFPFKCFTFPFSHFF